MNIFIKLPSRGYQFLRAEIPIDSPVREALEKATPIESVLDGVQFEGYNIPCNQEQAEIILEILKQNSPELVRDVEDAIMLARSGTK
jgi:hypothetical protein